MKNNYTAKYKTTQLYDLSKRVYNAVNNLGVLQEWSAYFGERTNFQHSDFHMPLACLQNLHCILKIVAYNLLPCYPKELLASLFMEACKFLATSLTVVRIVAENKSSRMFRASESEYK